MKILHFKNVFLEKSETFVYDQIGTGSVACFYRKNAHLFPCAVHELARARLFPMDRALASFTGTSFLLRSVVEKEQPEILHAHFGNDALNAAFLGNKVPMVTSFYGYDVYAFPGRRSYAHLFSSGRTFLVLGRQMAAALERLGCGSERIVVHHLGVDTRAIRPARKKKKGLVFCIVARFIEKKGIEYAIRAFALLAKKYEDAYLRIVGDGPLRGELMGLAHALAPRRISFVNNFMFADPRQKVMEEIGRCDVFVLPSVTARNGDKEGTPLVLMEAHAMAKPCIATRHSDIPEVVIDGKTGILAAERGIAELHRAMERLYGNARLRSAMGASGRRHIEQEFNLRRQLQKLHRIYEAAA